MSVSLCFTNKFICILFKLPHKCNVIYLPFSIWPISLRMIIFRPIHVAANGILSLSFNSQVISCMGFPGGPVVKNLPANAGDSGSIPGWGRFPLRSACNPLQYSCLENPTDRRAWQATVPGVATSRTQLSMRSRHILCFPLHWNALGQMRTQEKRKGQAWSKITLFQERQPAPLKKSLSWKGSGEGSDFSRLPIPGSS